MSTETTNKYEDMPLPIVHVIFPSKTIAKYSYKSLHEILEGFVRDGYSYIVEREPISPLLSTMSFLMYANLSPNN